MVVVVVVLLFVEPDFLPALPEECVFDEPEFVVGLVACFLGLGVGFGLGLGLGLGLSVDFSASGGVASPLTV